MKNEITIIDGANWVTLSGAFTPEELRTIADDIEIKFKEFKDKQDGNTD